MVCHSVTLHNIRGLLRIDERQNVLERSELDDVGHRVQTLKSVTHSESAAKFKIDRARQIHPIQMALSVKLWQSMT